MQESTEYGVIADRACLLFYFFKFKAYAKHKN